MNHIWFPWQRALRTGLAVIASSIVTIATTLSIIALAAPQVLTAAQALLRPEDYLLLGTWVATLSAVSAGLSRIMAIPAVDDFLKRFGVGSAPAGAIAYTGADGSLVGLTRRQYRALTQGADTGEKGR